MAPNLDKVRAVKKKHESRWLRLEGVVGVGVGRGAGGEACVVVSVTRKTPRLAHKIPQRVEGVPVTIEETGSFEAFGEQ